MVLFACDVPFRSTDVKKACTFKNITTPSQQMLLQVRKVLH